MARILIVEDEEKIARFVTLELEHEGYQVEHAADGRTAVDLALEHDYDLILLDVLLPQLNGMEVLRRVRKHKDVPVIMVTARDAVMDKVAGLDAGADDYLTKPFAIEELFAQIRVALKRAEAVRAASGVGGVGAGDQRGLFHVGEHAAADHLGHELKAVGLVRLAGFFEVLFGDVSLAGLLQTCLQVELLLELVDLVEGLLGLVQVAALAVGHVALGGLVQLHNLRLELSHSFSHVFVLLKL